jgi:hypothetical protein
MDTHYHKIVNLYKFNINFSKYADNKPFDMSPDYIIEKYNHWIGFTPTVEYKVSTSDDMTHFFNVYWERWKSFNKYERDVKNILMYLIASENLQLTNMFSKFEEYIGPFDLISDEANKRGLHFLSEEFVYELIEGNKKNMKVVLRELNLRSLI